MDEWPDETVELTELGIAIGTDLDKGMPIDEAIRNIKQRIAEKTTSFTLGQVVITRNALESLPQYAVQAALQRHASGDWGDICEQDRGLNDQSLKDGSRILSVYHAGQTKFWIITEAADDSGHRAATTVLLPEDY